MQRQRRRVSNTLRVMAVTAALFAAALLVMAASSVMHAVNSWEQVDATVISEVTFVAGRPVVDVQAGELSGTVPADVWRRPGEVVSVWSDGSALSSLGPLIPLIGAVTFAALAAMVTAVMVTVAVTGRPRQLDGESLGETGEEFALAELREYDVWDETARVGELEALAVAANSVYAPVPITVFARPELFDWDAGAPYDWAEDAALR
jgi:hypothetical protein